MGNGFKETSKFNVDQKKFDEGHARIFGKKETGIKCDDCSSTNAKATTCPFDEAVNDEDVNCNLCDDCYEERADNI